MNADLYVPSYGPIALSSGWPSHSRLARLPMGQELYAEEAFGSIQLQEIRLNQLVFRFFSFYFQKDTVLISKEADKGIQSLIALKGAFRHDLNKASQQLLEGQFTLLVTHDQESQTLVPGGAECRIFNASYPPETYNELLVHFPGLQQQVRSGALVPGFYLTTPRPSRLSTLEAIREIIYDRYQVQLQAMAWQLKLKQIFFSQLAQTLVAYTAKPSSPQEQALAGAAQAIIQENLKKHYSIEELAEKLNCSTSTLKRAFHKQFGMGIYEYLMQLRMYHARELLLRGEQVKTASLEVGMRPSNFSVEFKKFFGYTATSIQGKNE